MNSPELLAAAIQWLIELETPDRPEAVWEEFANWFQASAAHREAYAQVRRTWLTVAQAPVLELRDPSPPKKIPWGAARRFGAEAWHAHWYAILTGAIGLIVAYGVVASGLGAMASVVFR